MAYHTDEQWKKIGLQIGRERGQLDNLAGMVQPVDRLWIPRGVDPAYVDGLREGYLETVTGQAVQLEI